MCEFLKISTVSYSLSTIRRSREAKPFDACQSTCILSSSTVNSPDGVAIIVSSNVRSDLPSALDHRGQVTDHALGIEFIISIIIADINLLQGTGISVSPYSLMACSISSALSLTPLHMFDNDS